MYIAISKIVILQKEEKDKGLVADQKSALEVEAEIFVIFPTFMCYFMEHVMKDGEELGITLLPLSIFSGVATLKMLKKFISDYLTAIWKI